MDNIEGREKDDMFYERRRFLEDKVVAMPYDGSQGADQERCPEPSDDCIRT